LPYYTELFVKVNLGKQIWPKIPCIYGVLSSFSSMIFPQFQSWEKVGAKLGENWGEPGRILWRSHYEEEKLQRPM
jgi:hypothetical protein